MGSFANGSTQPEMMATGQTRWGQISPGKWVMWMRFHIIPEKNASHYLNNQFFIVSGAQHFILWHGFTNSIIIENELTPPI
jgi:hypothetical protein